jgi:uncharacterized protein
LVKVASRCNLDCDYCYMYHHADQGWRKMPAFLSTEHEDLLAFRIAEYAQKVQLTRLLIVYHGGEPLLVGINALERITTKIKNSLPAAIAVDFSIQTNGTLLTEELLDKLETLNISVSLSLDGPEVIHDKHRVDHAGKPSFKKVQTALEMLLKRKQIFSGLIAVIDPVLSPDKLLEYFDAYAIPNLDILLPDANYVRLPPGKENNPNLYIDWLLKCFDLWFDKFPHIRIRFFDSILDSIVGLPSKTDALGFGNVSLLTIETDGSYHDLDVLKIAYDGASNLHLGGLSTTSVENAVQSSQIQKHSYLLTKEGLSDICQECSVVDTCAGGAVPHRYSLEGFVNPTIYCDELFALINHAKKRLTEQLENEIDNSKADSLLNFSKEDLLHFEDTSLSFSLLEHMLSSWGELQKEKFKEALLHSQDSNSGVTNSVQLLLELSEDQFKYLSLQPSVYTWTNVTNAAKKGESVTNIDGKSILIDYSYVERIPDFLKNNFSTQRINRNDNWLRAPFGEKIQYENTDSTLKATIILEDAYQLINQWDSNLLKEIKLISPEVQFIKDITAHPEKIVSFSDNSVPGALYVTVKIGDKYIDAADLADSILHEYRHQKLYLLQRISDVISIDVPLVRSPWREELRPPSGLFHALYVFSFLRNFWQHLAVTTNIIFKKRAEKEVSVITDRIMEGIDTVRNTRLTETGICLLNILELNSTKVLQ